MFPFDLRPGRTFRFSAVALLLGALLCVSGAPAQDVPSLEEIQQDYRIVELSRGWVLQPLRGDDFETLEILDGAVTVDGAELSVDDLRRFVDDDAEWILAMAAGTAPGTGEAEAIDPEPPEPPEPPVVDAEDEVPSEEEEPPRRHRNRRDSQVSFGGGLVVEEDESVREVVLFSGPLTVLGEVDGDATVILGSATVSGRVDGSLTVIGGTIRLESTAEIDGDVVAVGGGIRQEPGARIRGEITQVDVAEAIEMGDLRVDFGRPNDFRPSFELFDFSWLDLFGRAIGLGLLLVVLLILLLLAPRKVAVVAERARQEPWKAGLVGLLVEVLFVPLVALVCVVLLISIVGIPLLIFVLPLMALAIIFYLLLGFAGVSLTTGQWLQKRFEWRPMSGYLLLSLGLFFIYGWSILGEALSITPWPIRLSAILLLMLGFCLKYLAWTIGLGAAILDQFAPLPTPETHLWEPPNAPPADPGSPDPNPGPSGPGLPPVVTTPILEPDASEDVRAPLSVEPTTDEPTTDESKPDEPKPDEPTPDEPTPDEPTPDGRNETSSPGSGGKP